MFPEYRDLITQLKTTDANFQRTYELHNRLDDEIRQLEKEYADSDQVRELKKKKLKLKEDLYEIIKAHNGASQ